MKFKLLAIISMFLFLSSFGYAQIIDGYVFPDQTYQGLGTYINDSKAYVAVTPNALYGDGYVYVDVTPKLFTGGLTWGVAVDHTKMKLSKPQYSDGTYKIEGYTCLTAFSYNATHFKCTYANNTLIFEHKYDYGNIATKTAYWYTEELNWYDIPKTSKSTPIFFDNKTRFFYFDNLQVTSGTTYKLRFYVDVPDLGFGQKQDWNAKYGIAFYPSSYGTNLGQALSNSALYYIDPYSYGSTNLVAYYSFDTSLTLDDYTQGYNFTSAGTIAQNTTIHKIGAGSAYSSAVSGRLIGNNYGLQNTDAYSLNMWVRPSQLTPGNPQFAYEKDGSPITLCGGPNWFSDSTDDIYGRAGNGATWDVASNLATNFTTTFNWYMLTFTWGDTAHSSNVSIYLNSSLLATGAVTCAGFNSAIDIIFGATNAGASGLFGFMDEISVWNKTLSQAEITALYNSGAGCDLACITASTDNKPTAVNITYSPSPAFDNASLVGAYDYYDADGDPENGTTFKWFKNGGVISGQTSLTLPNSQFVHFDNLTIEITAANNNATGDPVNGSTVQIQNLIPVISGVAISPTIAYEYSNLTGTYTYYDADGDADQSTYKWFKNGAQIAGETTTSLGSGNFTVGDMIIFEVYGFDGYNYSIAPINSSVIEILNSSANFSISAYDFYDGSSILNFSAFINYTNFTTLANYNTTYVSGVDTYYVYNNIGYAVELVTNDTKGVTRNYTIPTTCALNNYFGIKVRYTPGIPDAVWDCKNSTGSWVTFGTAGFFPVVTAKINFTGFGYTTTTGVITTGLNKANDGEYSIYLESLSFNGGYYNKTYLLYNVSLDLSASMVQLFQLYNWTYSNYIINTGVNYTRVLNYAINYTCNSDYSTNLLRYINGTYDSSLSLSCGNSSAIYTGTYQYWKEGAYNISFYLNTSYLPILNNDTTGYADFYSDLYAPSATINITVNNSFSYTTANISLYCYDTAQPTLHYNLTFNDNNLYYNNRSNGYNQSNTSAISNGENIALGACSDFLSETNVTTSITAYQKLLFLIDERLNTLFDVSNISRARVYFDDNSTYFDYKTANVSSVNITAAGTVKLRFDLGYSDGTTITRYVDLSLTGDDVRVCANTEGVTHYEQIILASRERRVIMNSIFANCLVAADYTRFGYQDYYSLKAYTIAQPYDLYHYNNGVEELLANYDGSISTYINIDVLEFNKRTYNFGITRDALTFKKSDLASYLMEIYYKNYAEDNENITLQITRLDTDIVVYTQSAFNDSNEFSINWDFSSLTNISNSTLFEAIVYKTSTSGTADSKIVYFNLAGQTGIFNSPFGMTIAILILLFGLTFTAVRYSLGWFGAIMAFIAIIVLSLTIKTWAVIMMMGICAIVFIYILLTLIKQTYVTLT